MRKADRLLRELESALREEATAIAAVEDSPAGKATIQALAALREGLRQIGRGDDVREIVAAEHQVMTDEREHNVTSLEQADFLDRGIHGMELALNLIDMARSDPERYRAISNSFRLPRNRINGLPNDDARKSFKDHRKELRSIIKASPLSRGAFHRDRVKLLEARLANLRQAERLYANLQRQVLDAEGPSGEGRGPQ